AQALTPLGNQISSGRRSQAYFESVMLAQDAAISRLKVQSKLTHRAYKQSRKALTRNGRAYRGRVRIVNARRARLSEAEAKHKDTPPEELPDWYLERVRSLRRDLAKAVRHRAAAARQLRASQRVSKARRARLGALKRM